MFIIHIGYYNYALINP